MNRSEFFEAQQVWQGVLTFSQVGVGLIAVAYRSPENAAGEFVEFWALKAGVRLSSQTLNDPTSLVSVRLTTTPPAPMTVPSDGAGFKTYAATQLAGALDFFRHDGKPY